MHIHRVGALGLAVSAVFCAYPAVVSAEHCAVAGIAVVVGSGAEYAAQAQDGAGAPCHASETLRLSFASSGAGTFLAPGGGSVSAFISKGSANRNFNYQGGASGDVLTVKAGYGAAESWSVAWQATHTVGASLGSADTSGSAPSSGSSSGVAITEVKSSVEPGRGTAAEPRIFTADPLTLTLGHPARASAGAPVQFAATPGGLPARELTTVRYFWNFGDGATSVARTPAHAYTRPGEYIVIVVARRQGHEITLRSTITILPVALSLERDAGGVLLLRSASPHEIEVSGLTVSDGEQSFVVPPETHLPPGGALALSRSLTGLVASARTAFVYDSAHALVAEYSPSAQEIPPVATLVSAIAQPRTVVLPPTSAPSVSAEADETTAVAPGETGLRAAVSSAAPAPPSPLSRAAPLAFVGVLAAGLFALYAPKMF